MRDRAVLTGKVRGLSSVLMGASAEAVCEDISRTLP